MNQALLNPNFSGMERSVKPYPAWGSASMQFRVSIYPPREPSNPFQPVDENGVPCDPYYVHDSISSWNIGCKWNRKIKIGGQGGQTITKALLKKSPYFKSIYDHINANYPLPTIIPYES